MKTNRLKRLKIILLTLLFSSFSFLAHANKVFDQLSGALRNRIPQVYMEKLQAKHKGQRIEGRGYVVSITEDISEGVVVTLSTEKDYTLSSSVGVSVYVRKIAVEDALKLKVGRMARFFGDFDEIRMRTIIVRRGFVK